MDVGNPFVGGPFTLLICPRWPLARSRLKVCITAADCVGITTRPFDELEYLVLQATRNPIATRVRIAAIHLSLVRILLPNLL
jgi:hypothetical protein